MKHTHTRFLVVICALLCSVVAIAADHSGYYRIKAPRSGKYVVETNSKLAVGTKTTVTQGNLNEIWQVRLIDDDTYAIINAASGSMVQAQPATQKEHSTSTTTCSPFFIKKSNSKYVISCAADFSGYSCWHEDSGNKIVVWNDTEANSQWTFTAVTGDDLAAAQTSVASHESAITKAITDANRMSILKNGGVFRLKSRYNHYASENASTHAVGTATSKKVNDLSQIWIISKSNSAYTIRNANTGRYLPDNGGADAALVTVEEAISYYIKTSAYKADYFTISWKSDFSGTNCLHENSKGNVVKWNANNASDGVKYSDWTIEPVDEADTEATVEKLREHMAQMQGIATKLVNGYYRVIPAAYPSRALAEDASSKDVITINRNSRYSQVWKIAVNENGTTCTFQNALSENYIKNSAGTSALYKTQAANSGNTFTIGTGGGEFDAYFNFRGASTGFHCASSQGYNVVGWDQNAEASQWILYPVTVDEAALAAEKAEVQQGADLQAHAATYNAKLQKYFEDYACTKVRADYATYTEAQLRSAMTADELPTILQDMAVRVLTDTWTTKSDKHNKYEKFFRIQDVQCYSDNQKWKEITQVGPFGELTSPTGIQVEPGDYVYIYVNEAPKTGGTLRALLAYDTEYRNKGELTLRQGLNVWQLPVAGEIFLNYFNANTEKQLSEFPNILVHIEGGVANGCWDASRGMDNTDWSWLKTNMFKGEFLHVKGHNTVLNVLKDKVKDATKPVEIMKGWDFAFLGLQKAIGHTGQWDGRYNPVVNPRHSYQGNPNWGGYAGSNHPGLTSGYLFNYDNFYENNIWEILHEIGHGCQYPIKMAGTTEVTNNSLSQIVSHMMGNNYSRGNGTDRLIQLFNYERDGKRGWSWVDYVRYATPFYDSSLHTGNHLLYQLYLYFEVMGHNPGFLTRMHNEMRKSPITYSGKDAINGTPKTYNDDFWKFAKACATASQTDLWEFFEAYGFWKYADEIISTSEDDPATTSTAYKNGNRFIGDYGNYSMKLPVRGNAADEKNMADLKAYMKSMPHKAPNLFFIDDHVRTNTVDPECFVAQINPSRAGKELEKYWQVPFVDYGDYRDFDGENHTSGLRYTIGTTTSTQSYTTDKGGEWDYKVSGRKVTMSGEGILGVKIYDDKGKLVQVANTKTFVIPTDMATALKNGTYSLHVAATPTLDIVMDKNGNPTDITSIESTSMDAAQSSVLYDLQGRPSQQLTPGRLYIRGGKKLLAR